MNSNWCCNEEEKGRCIFDASSHSHFLLCTKAHIPEKYANLVNLLLWQLATSTNAPSHPCLPQPQKILMIDIATMRKNVGVFGVWCHNNNSVLTCVPHNCLEKIMWTWWICSYYYYVLVLLQLPKSHSLFLTKNSSHKEFLDQHYPMIDVAMRKNTDMGVFLIPHHSSSSHSLHSATRSHS